LLFKESWLQKAQVKWTRNLSLGHITVLDQLYTLKLTDSKRKLIYNENNKFVNTVPYVININKEVVNK
jgi:hypothetical protein